MLTVRRGGASHGRERTVVGFRRRDRRNSWGEIGRVLGVSKQSLHRRFGDLG
jgi:hypothetical protein